jgi:MEMO1 family protein
MKIRKPAVAGSFYPGKREELLSVIRELESNSKSKVQAEVENKKIIGGIVPHAGYMYSGKIAVPFFQAISLSAAKFETILILHPNHSGRGPAIASDTHEAWETPLGVTDLDIEFKEHLGLAESSEAHQFEHSAEVMLPFLQYFMPYSFRILPIALSHQTPESGKVLAEKIRNTINNTGRTVLIIASSDFSHYVSPIEGATLDDKAIAHIKTLDTQAFYQTVMKYNLSICGYGPIMTLMEYTNNDSKTHTLEILARGHSGRTNFDDEVVHYVSMLFHQTILK